MPLEANPKLLELLRLVQESTPPSHHLSAIGWDKNYELCTYYYPAKPWLEELGLSTRPIVTSASTYYAYLPGLILGVCLESPGVASVLITSTTKHSKCNSVHPVLRTRRLSAGVWGPLAPTGMFSALSSSRVETEEFLENCAPLRPTLQFDF